MTFNKKKTTEKKRDDGLPAEVTAIEKTLMSETIGVKSLQGDLNKIGSQNDSAQSRQA